MAPDVLKLAANAVMIGAAQPTGPDAYGQPVAVSAFVPMTTYSGRRRIRRTSGVQYARQEKMGDPFTLDRRVPAPRGGKALSDALGKLGAPPGPRSGLRQPEPDFTPVVLAWKQSGADVLGTYFTFENDLGIFALHSCASSASTFPGWDAAFGGGGVIDQTGGSGALRHPTA